MANLLNEQEFISAEIKTLLAKSVIVKTKHEPREFISSKFVRYGGFRLTSNLQRLYKAIEYKKFKMETISTIIHLVRPSMYIAKLDVMNSYYSVPICGDHQSLLKFQYQNCLTQWIYRRS